jgi:hypothetical protein
VGNGEAWRAATMVARRAKAAAQGRRWLNLDCVARGGSGERNRVSGMNFLNLSALGTVSYIRQLTNEYTGPIFIG